MAVEIKVPALGESVTEATVAKWLVKAGDTVAVDEPLCELETDKVTVEVNATVGGRLAELAVAAAPPSRSAALLCHIEAGAARRRAEARRRSPPPKAAARRGRSGRATLTAPAPALAPSASRRPISPPSGPAARKLAEEKGVDRRRDPAPGKDGRATKADVMAALSLASGSAAGAAPPGPPCPPVRACAPTARSG